MLTGVHMPNAYNTLAKGKGLDPASWPMMELLVPDIPCTSGNAQSSVKAAGALCSWRGNKSQ